MVVALSLSAAACTRAQVAPKVSVATPVSSVTTTKPVPPTATTTTTTVASVEVSIVDDPEAAAVVSALYTWLSDRQRPMPEMPRGLRAHLEPRKADEKGPLAGELFSAQISDMGRAAVARVDGEDIILLVDDGRGWRIVGAWLARYGFAPWFGDPIRHVLVMGTDAREWQDQEHLRADSLHILSSNISDRAGGILGIPRDSWVQAPYGRDKFTNVNAIMWTRSGNLIPGQEYMVSIARDLTGLPIEGYILTGFRDFQLLLNDYGGVEVDIPFDMADSSSGAYFDEGRQTLYGRLALAFSRNRHIRGGDFTRSFHQGLVMMGKLRGILETDFSTLPWWVAGLAEHTWTSLSLEDLFTLAAGAYLLDPWRVGNEVLPGRVATRGGASVVIISDSAETLYRDMDDGVLGEDLVVEEAPQHTPPH